MGSGVWDYGKSSIGFDGNLVYSSGITKQPSFTISPTTFEIIIDNTGVVNLFDNANFENELKQYYLPSAVLGPLPDAITAPAAQYIYADYNNGSPIYKLTTDVNLIDMSSSVPCHTLSRVGSDIIFLDWDSIGLSPAAKLVAKDILTNRFSLINGIVPSFDSSLYLTMSPGSVSYGVRRIKCNEFTSTTSGKLRRLTYTAGVVSLQSVSALNNSLYTDGTNMLTATDGKYLASWLCLAINYGADTCYVVEIISNDQYDSDALADSAAMPSIPAALLTVLFPLYKTVILKNATVPEIYSLTATIASSIQEADAHNDLIGLQGGDGTNYYHSDQAIDTTDSVNFVKMSANGATSDGSTDLFSGYDLADVKVYSVNTDGDILPGVDNSAHVGNSSYNYSTVNTRAVTSNDDLNLDAGTSKVIVANKSITPKTNILQSLGTTLLNWLNVFTRAITSNDDLTVTAASGKSVIMASNILPNANNSLNLGQSSTVFKEVDTRLVYSDDNLVLDTATGKNIVTNKTMLPNANNTLGVGSSTYNYAEVDTRKVISNDDLNLDAYTGKNIIANKNVNPVSNNNLTLGTTGLNYSEVHSRAVISDDDLSLDATTGKNIVAKKSVNPFANITYNLGTALLNWLTAYVTNITSNIALTLTSAATYAINITSGTTGAVNIDSGTTGTINVGTSSNAKTINVGNNSSITDVNLSVGSGNANINSTTGGFKVPRMTLAQRVALTGTEGLQVYQTDAGAGNYIYTNSVWQKVSNMAFAKSQLSTETPPAINGYFSFTNSVVSRGIASNNGNGTYTLYPGTYEVVSSIPCVTTNSTYITYQAYNLTTSAVFGTQGSGNYANNTKGNSSLSYGVLVVTVNTIIAIQRIGGNATALDTTNSWFKIIQLA